MRQGTTPLRERRPRGVQERPTKPAPGTRTAVDRGGAAQTHDDRLGTALDGLPHQLADAPGRCPQRVELLGREEGNAARRRTLENRGFRVEPPDFAGHWLPQGPGDLDAFAERRGRQHGVKQAVATVRNWTLKHRGVRDSSPGAKCKRISHLAWSQCALKGCWGDEDYLRHAALCSKVCILRQ